MATPFHVIVDDVLEPRPRGLTGYARGLLGAMTAAPPSGIEVVGFVSSSPEQEYDEIARLLPGLAGLEKSTLAQRELAAAWQHGLPSTIGRLVHAPSLFAPLRAAGGQTVVTVHDAVAWLEPDAALGPAGWYRAMGKRADRFADAVVVPSHAVAAAFEELGLFADRMRVIPAAGTPGLAAPPDAAARRTALGLPDRYVAATATLNPRRRLPELLQAMRGLEADLVLLGDPSWSDADVVADRVTIVSDDAPGDRAAVLAGASAFVEPGRLEGFGADVLDAMTVGVPVVMTDDPALVELAADAAVVVPAGGRLVEDLHDALGALLADPEEARLRGIAGQDRARAFTWRDAAERVWQLHAEL